MAFLLKELFLLTLVATVLTFPWYSRDAAVVDESPPDEVYPLTSTKQETSSTAVNADEIYPGTSTKRENEPIDTDSPVDKALRDVYPVEQDATAVDESPPDEVYPLTGTKQDVTVVDESPPDEVYPLTSTKQDAAVVDESPPDEVYPLTSTKQETSSTAVNADEIYPGTSTKREHEPIDTDSPVDKALRDVYPVEQAPRVKRGAVTANSGKRWPVATDGNGDNIVNIMYTIKDDLNNDAKRWLKTVLHQLDQDTCIHFVDWNGDSNSYYVKFQPGSGGCSSDIGYRQKIQTVDLGAGCQYRKTIAHEIMHLLGFYHEHTRSDRDNYLTVYEENIASGLSGQFAIKYDQDNLGSLFDEHSIMQYSENAFSSNPGDSNFNTMVAIDGQKLGQNSHMDAMDVNKINELYGCNRRTFVDHTIVLNTGSNWYTGAGTDADPFVRLIGSTGTTPYQLVTSGGMLYADENEAGASETHKLPFPDVGTISSVEITLVDKGSTPSKKRKRALKRAQSKWRQEKRWGDGWSLDSVVIDGVNYEGSDLDVGDTATLSTSK